MIVLDTHIWRWWVSGHPRLTAAQRQRIEAEPPTGIRVSVISCWEMAKAVETGNLTLSIPVDQWFDEALRDPHVVLHPLTPICVESTRLPAPIHRDPGDQIIIATARVLDCPLLTADQKILSYPHVKLA